LTGAVNREGTGNKDYISDEKVRASLSEDFYSINETVLYVAPDGNDNWSGSLDEVNSDGSNGPLATLEGARTAVREIIAEGLNGPVSVFIREGEYDLEETIVYSVADAGSVSSPITYKAYPGEKPVFTGGKKLNNWEPCEYDPEGLPAAARGKLYTVSIPEELKGKWQITSLYDGNRLLSRSRSGRLKVSEDHVPDLNNVQPKNFRIKEWDGKPLVFSRELTYKGEDIKSWSNPSDIEILISPRNNWLINMLPLERIDAEKKIIHSSCIPGNGYRLQPFGLIQPTGIWLIWPPVPATTVPLEPGRECPFESTA